MIIAVLVYFSIVCLLYSFVLYFWFFVDHILIIRFLVLCHFSPSTNLSKTNSVKKWFQEFQDFWIWVLPVYYYSISDLVYNLQVRYFHISKNQQRNGSRKFWCGSLHQYLLFWKFVLYFISLFSLFVKFSQYGCTSAI